MLAGTQWNEKKLLEIKKNIVQKSGKCVTQDFNFFGVFFFFKRHSCNRHGYLQENVQRVKKELDVLAFYNLQSKNKKKS